MENLKRVHDTIKHRTVLIESITTEGVSDEVDWWGTGFLFDDMLCEELLCLTARHCITTTGKYADKNILPTSSICITSLYLKEKFEVLEVLEIIDEAKYCDDFVDLALLKLRYTGDIDDLRNLDKIRLMSEVPSDPKIQFMFFGFPKINEAKKEHFKTEEEILQLYHGEYLTSAGTAFDIFVGAVDASEGGDAIGMVKGVSGAGALIESAGELFLVGIVTAIRPNAQSFHCEKITHIKSSLKGLGRERKFETEDDFNAFENENCATQEEEDENKRNIKLVRRKLESFQQRNRSEAFALNWLRYEFITYAKDILCDTLAIEISETFDHYLKSLELSEGLTTPSRHNVVSGIIKWFEEYHFGTTPKNFLKEFIKYFKTITENG